MIEGLKPLYVAALKPLSRLLSRFGIHPNAITITGVLFFCAGGYVTAIGYWKTALLFFGVGACMDGLDGVLARDRGKKSRFGAVLDSVCDRITEIAWLGSLMAYYCMNRITILPLLVFAALCSSIMVSYVKARAEGAGFECSRGVLQRPERLIILALFQFLGPRYMAWGLAAIAGLSVFTVFQRLIEVWKQYKAEKRGGEGFKI